MLMKVGSPKSFYSKSIATTTYLIKICQFIAIYFKTPMEVWSEKSIDLL